jgi:predicted nucleotidyltransferase/HEPN domain-containing protein
MKTSLEHLPESKRRELSLATEILFAEFQDAIIGGTMPHKRQGRILKIILFGSYARGDWVEDPVGGYVSDYDLLIVVNYEQLTETLEYWAKADDHLLREYAVGRHLSAPVNFVVHSMTDVNQRLRLGRYFFTDIVRDGIALYETPGHPFDRPRTLAPAEALAEAEGFYEEWFPKAESALKGARFYVGENEPKDAAFLLHQATERLYHCVLLALTLYSPKSHKLNFLRSQAEQLDARLIEAWPRGTRFEQRCFELLRRAYVDARYSPHYKITAKELAWLNERITALQGLVRAVCDERLARLRAQI